MIDVAITRAQWDNIASKSNWDLQNKKFHMSCGLTIPDEDIIFQFSWTGSYYIIRLAGEQEAAWFVLSYGGDVIPTSNPTAGGSDQLG